MEFYDNVVRTLVKLHRYDSAIFLDTVSHQSIRRELKGVGLSGILPTIALTWLLGDKGVTAKNYYCQPSGVL